MDEQAEVGIAAHWRYKEGGTDEDLPLVADILYLQETTADPAEFFDALKLDLYQARVGRAHGRGGEEDKRIRTVAAIGVEVMLDGAHAAVAQFVTQTDQVQRLVPVLLSRFLGRAHGRKKLNAKRFGLLFHAVAPLRLSRLGRVHNGQRLHRRFSIIAEPARQQENKPRLVKVATPTDSDITEVIQKFSQRVIRKLRKLRCLETGIDVTDNMGSILAFDNRYGGQVRGRRLAVDSNDPISYVARPTLVQIRLRNLRIATRQTNRRIMPCNICINCD